MKRRLGAIADGRGDTSRDPARTPRRLRARNRGPHVGRSLRSDESGDERALDERTDVFSPDDPPMEWGRAVAGRGGGSGERGMLIGRLHGHAG